MTAEMKDRGVEFVQMAHQLVDAGRPPRFEPEIVAVRRQLQLALNLGALLTELKQAAPVSVRRKEQDHVLRHDSVQLRVPSLAALRAVSTRTRAPCPDPRACHCRRGAGDRAR